jgi:hypothetical protein
MKKLRKVVDLVNKFLPEDHNDHVDNWKEQASFNEFILANLADPDPELEELVNKLKSLVATMRRVKSGDFYYADDHNKFVDAWELQSSINELLQELAIPCPVIEAGVFVPIPETSETYTESLRDSVEIKQE